MESDALFEIKHAYQHDRKLYFCSRAEIFIAMLFPKRGPFLQDVFFFSLACLEMFIADKKAPLILKRSLSWVLQFNYFIYETMIQVHWNDIIFINNKYFLLEILNFFRSLFKQSHFKKKTYLDVYLIKVVSLFSTILHENTFISAYTYNMQRKMLYVYFYINNTWSEQ